MALWVVPESLNHSFEGLLFVFDASVSNDFKIHEALNFQFRVDAFNVINHTNFQAPSGALSVTAVGTNATFASSSGFGKITGTQPNRQMQLSGRFFF